MQRFESPSVASEPLQKRPNVTILSHKPNAMHRATEKRQDIRITKFVLAVF